MKRRRCALCEKEKICSAEGRIIDGSWTLDYKLPNYYFGKWVCSWKCYKALIDMQEVRKNG